MSRIKSSVRSQIIEASVQEYFRERAHEAYNGQVCLHDVVEAVKHVLNTEWNARMTEAVVGEVYDWIREYGPVGEGDERWLKLYRTVA